MDRQRDRYVFLITGPRDTVTRLGACGNDNHMCRKSTYIAELLHMIATLVMIRLAANGFGISQKTVP